MDLRGQLPINTFPYLVNKEGNFLYDGTGSKITSLNLTTSYALYQVMWEESSSFASHSLTTNNVKINDFTTQVGTQIAQQTINTSSTVLIGPRAGQYSGMLDYGIIIGSDAASQASASDAVIIGSNAGRTANDAYRSVFIGSESGFYSKTGSYCTFVGYGTDTFNPNLCVSKSIVLGANAKVAESNTCAIGGTGDYAVKVVIGGTTATNTLTVVGSVSCSVITASAIQSSTLFQLPYSSSIKNFTPVNLTGSAYFVTNTKLLYIYTGQSWSSCSLV